MRLLPPALLLITAVGVLAAQTRPATLDIYFVDTEGGQSTLYVGPTGESLLVDTGNAAAFGFGSTCWIGSEITVSCRRRFNKFCRIAPLPTGVEFIDKPPTFAKEMRDRFNKEDYHQPSDEVKPDWDLSGAVEDAELMAVVGYRVANADKFPEWKPGNEFRAKREAMLKK